MNKPVKFQPERENDLYQYAQSINFTAKVKEWLQANMEGRLFIKESANSPIPVVIVNEMVLHNTQNTDATQQHKETDQIDDIAIVNPDEIFPDLSIEGSDCLDSSAFIS